MSTSPCTWDSWSESKSTTRVLLPTLRACNFTSLVTSGIRGDVTVENKANQAYELHGKINEDMFILYAMHHIQYFQIIDCIFEAYKSQSRNANLSRMTKSEMHDAVWYVI